MTRTPNTNDDDVSLQLPAEDEVLLQKLREESRAVLLQRKSRELLDNEELQVNLKTKVKLVKYTYTCIFLSHLMSKDAVQNKESFLRSHLYFVTDVITPIVDYCVCFFPLSLSLSVWSLCVQNLWFLLDKHQVPPQSGEEAMISYEAFLQVGEKAGPKCK